MIPGIVLGLIAIVDNKDTHLEFVDLSATGDNLQLNKQAVVPVDAKDVNDSTDKVQASDGSPRALVLMIFVSIVTGGCYMIQRKLRKEK